MRNVEAISEDEMKGKLVELLKGDKVKAKIVEEALDILKETRFDGSDQYFREFMWVIRRLAMGECLHQHRAYLGTTAFKIGYKCEDCGEEIWTND